MTVLAGRNSWSRLFVLEGNRVIAEYIAASEILFEAATGVPDKFMGRGCAFGYHAELPLNAFRTEIALSLTRAEMYGV